MTKENQIKAWFENDRSFEAGKQLFNKFGSNIAFKTLLNRQGNSPTNFKYLCYELAKTAGISEASYKMMLQVPLRQEIRETPVDVNSLAVADIIAKLNEINVLELDWQNIQAVVKTLDLKPTGKKKQDLMDAINEQKKQSFIKQVPDNVKKAIRLREEYPFLKSKSCPEELKILVADMLTAYDTYIEGHQQLKEESDPDIIAALSQSVVENYLENRQIWEELNHYRDKKELLGKHPIFDWVKRRNEIQALKTPDLINLKDQLQNKIPRTRKKIADEPDHKENPKRQERIELFEKELELVKQLLNL